MADTVSSSLFSPTISPTSLHGNLYSSLIPPADATAVKDKLLSLKGDLGSIEALLDSVGLQTEKMLQTGWEVETAEHLSKVRSEMSDQERRHIAQVEEIKALFENVLAHDVVEHLRQMIDAGVLEQIDEIVKDQVAAHLPGFFPEEDQQELEACKRELAEAQRQLHNSESRRANSTLRSSRLKDPLHTIYKADGTISERFPKDVHSLFYMDGESVSIDVTANT
ncbi:hypothetical protein K474DRAFT_1658640 [Panus rudis PR-1116 ss-1]|nr:hypothetical protein K474DRAFT_1658640 [Panus rudis PR-1116 ss-1]